MSDDTPLARLRMRSRKADQPRAPGFNQYGRSEGQVGQCSTETASLQSAEWILERVNYCSLTTLQLPSQICSVLGNSATLRRVRSSACAWGRYAATQSTPPLRSAVSILYLVSHSCVLTYSTETTAGGAVQQPAAVPRAD